MDGPLWFITLIIVCIIREGQPNFYYIFLELEGLQYSMEIFHSTCQTLLKNVIFHARII